MVEQFVAQDAAAEPQARNWQGRLKLVFNQANGRTQLGFAQGQAPLKVQRPFYPEGEAVCHSVMLHTAGGVVGSDRLSFDIQLQPQAQALITTAAATKIYTSNGFEAKQSTQIEVAEGACLEWLPQETIVFNGARYHQQLKVNLAENALWMGWEITRLGRSARGEKFGTGEWRSHTEIWQQDRLIWVDPQRVQGGTEMMTSLHGLAACPVVGSFAIVGQSVSPELVEQARTLWQQGNYAGEMGVTRLMAGMLCRYRGSSTGEARRWFTEVWALLRLELLNRPVCKPRVWQV